MKNHYYFLFFLLTLSPYYQVTGEISSQELYAEYTFTRHEGESFPFHFKNTSKKSRRSHKEAPDFTFPELIKTIKIRYSHQNSTAWLLRKLSSFKNIEQLEITESNLNDRDLKELVKKLPKLKHLHTLDLSDNKVTVSSARKLAQLLSDAPSITTLCLTGNKLSGQQERHVFDTIAEHAGLENPPEQEQSEEERRLINIQFFNKTFHFLAR